MVPRVPAFCCDEKLSDFPGTMDKKPNEELEAAPAPAPRKDDSIAVELVRARKVLGWTQNELHQRTGISRDTIKQYETGRHLPGARELRLLSTALGISPNRLLLGADEFQLEPSLLQGLMSDQGADEVKKTMRFMLLYGMLTPAERNAVLTLIEPILTGRQGGEKGIRKAFAGLDVLSEYAAPAITGMTETMAESFDRKTVAKMNREIRDAAKDAK
jgi:transcriptional regulator with XRE-family HTH domain